MINKFLILPVLVVAFIITYPCKTTLGQGGNAQIKGRYLERKHDALFTYVTGGTTVNTNANGEFAFTYLRTGKYKVAIYNQRALTATQSSQYPTETYVFLNSKSEIKDLGLDTINQSITT